MANGWTALDATRVFAAALCGHAARQPAPRWVRRGESEAAEALHERLRLALGLCVDDLATPAPDLPPPARPAEAFAASLLEGVAAPLQDWAVGAAHGPLRWPRHSFLDGDPPHDTAPARKELLGPSRSLVFGPYLHLPTGSWEAELRLFFDGRAAGRSFRVDMISNDVIGTISVRPAEAGTFLARLLFRHDHPGPPLALRVVLERGAIEGEMGLQSVTLRRYSVA
jgi:hypothetical protein